MRGEAALDGIDDSDVSSNKVGEATAEDAFGMAEGVDGRAIIVEDERRHIMSFRTKSKTLSCFRALKRNDDVLLSNHVINPSPENTSGMTVF
ncbi:hypothetical protein HN51_030037 [Arachis hypogaea]